MDLTSSRPPRVWLAVCAAFLLGACGNGSTTTPPPGGGTIPGCAGGDGPFRVISGTVRYERLVLKTSGLGPEREMKPARFVDVEVQRDEDGACLGRTSTNASGGYSVAVAVADGTVLRVVAISRTAFDPVRDYTVHQADPPVVNAHDPNNAFSHGVGGIPGFGAQTVDIDVPYGPDMSRPAIGFGVLDTIVTCMDQVRTAIAPTALQPVHAYTRLGNNGLLGASFYRPGANAIAILGGAAGNLDTSDTDYFDDPVVAHELGHFVENTISHSMSRGGAHGGEPLEPNFAFSEGQATGFGNALLGTPLYVDSTTTNNDLFFNFDCENVTGQDDPPGIGGELTVAEILWDLFDSGALDTDGDNVDTPLSSMYAALASFAPDIDAPYIGLFLDRLDVAPGNTVTTAQLTTLMTVPEDQGITYPVPANAVFPTPIVVNGPAQTGTCDSRPGPNKNTCKGITTTAWFRLSVPATTTVTIGLDVQPIAGSGDDLNLFLFNNNDVNNAIGASTSFGAGDESIVATVGGPGEYIILVEAVCGGLGNRASFSLTVTQ